jgi:hypothetical protein
MPDLFPFPVELLPYEAGTLQCDDRSSSTVVRRSSDLIPISVLSFRSTRKM